MALALLKVKTVLQIIILCQFIWEKLNNFYWFKM